MKTLRFIGVATIIVALSVNFIACSDDEEKAEEMFFIGAWAQDGDDDIFVLNADGTGVSYDSETLYKRGEVDDFFSWTYNNEWLYLDDDELRAESVSSNKIVWRRYFDGYFETANRNRDAFGWYELWTWERYTK